MLFSKKITLINFLISVLFLLDRFTKWLAFQIPEEGFFLISENFIGLKLYQNQNLIFNLKINAVALFGLIFFVLLILFFFLIKSYRQQKIFLIFNFSLIIAGAISNLLDRFYFGYVVDFLNFFNYSIFNLSDVFIVVGVGLILIREFHISKIGMGVI